jgi:hypothetical protein
MDGNNSLKRMAEIGGRASDSRVFEHSDYYLSSAFVDTFKDEVPSRRHLAQEDNESNGDRDLPAVDGSPVTACPENWKAAAPDEKKRMWAMFCETGIYASACRHGQILWIADMVRSGEQYALYRNRFNPIDVG